MDPRKHKIYRYLNTRYHSMLEKETEIIQHIRTGDLDQCLLMYTQTTSRCSISA